MLISPVVVFLLAYQGAKKVSSTADHLGKLYLTCISPRGILTRPIKFLMS